MESETERQPESLAERLRKSHLAICEEAAAEIERLASERDYWERARNEWEKACRIVQDELAAANAASAMAREVLANFEIRQPDADGLVWLVFNGNGTAGKGMINLGDQKRVVAQVALHFESDRRAALAIANSARDDARAEIERLRATSAAHVAGGKKQCDIATAVTKQRNDAEAALATAREALESVKQCAFGIMPIHNDMDHLKSIIVKIDSAEWTRLFAIFSAASSALASLPAPETTR